MSGGGEGKEERCRPPKECDHGLSEQFAQPAEASGRGTALELGEPFGSERASEENGEQKQRDAADLAAQR